ncbi:hypothetical protein A9Q87_00700 [Flavobacteriales bacterium 34_180_T64]|mgnify:CR=1 FL=1|nr:hypothetical protein A9Q87_00700 [Flavobacteriales bacterium 34_180_T64]
MKKITLFFALCAFSFGYSQNGGDTCGTAVEALPGSFTATQINVGPLFGEGGGIGAQSSAWFYYDATADGTIDVSSCGALDSDTRLYIGVGTCGTLTMVTDDDGCGTLRSLYTDYPVTNGTRYYIEWDDRWSSGGDPFDWTLTFNTPPACGEPTNVTIDAFNSIQADFSWGAPAFGAVVDYDWEIVPQGDGQGNNVVTFDSTTSTSDSATGLTPNTAYDLFVRTDCGDPPASTYIGPISFTTLGPPPAGDLACAPIAITVGYMSTSQAHTNADATTEASEPGGTCWFTPGSVSNSVWFEFTIASPSNMTISTDFTGGSLGDTQIAVYSGDCSDLSTLVEVGCDDDSGTALLSLANINPLAAGTYLIQIEGFGGDVGTFDLALTGTTLNVEQFENPNEFTYFPNPVKNELTLKAQSNIQNVSIYNMLGQEVLRTAPNTVRSEVSMSSLQSGAYFVKVTINDVTDTIRIIKQ